MPFSIHTRRRALVAGLIAGLPALMFLGVWRLGGASALGDDLIYYLPVRQYIGERIRAGELPLWNPLAAMGTSVAADPQSGLWYPFTALFVVLPPLAAYSLNIYLHFVLAGWGMYRFLRSGGRVWQAALLGAIAFEFSGYLVAHRGHLTILQASAWLPWMFYGWQRFAQAGRYGHFLLASAAFGIQLLVQHIQPSIITALLLTGYVAVVLWPQRRSLIWLYPAGMMLGVMLAGVQILPTWFHFADSGRATPAWYLFVENSWVLPSTLMFLFPMVYGAAIPNAWAEPWWGISHFCEQWPYGTILILLLAVASLGLMNLRIPIALRFPRPNLPIRIRKSEAGLSTAGCWHPKEVLFWWGASLAALVLAAGDLTPVSRLMFHLPVYASLRVPARWILVWSVAMPVLASLVMSAVLTGGAEAERLRRSIRWLATRGLPVAAMGSLLLLGFAAHQGDRLPQVFVGPDRDSFIAGARQALRLGNPAIWWPLAMMVVTAFLLVLWSTRRSRLLYGLLFGVFIIDIASVAPFVDVDFHTYSRRHLQDEPPLAAEIRRLGPQDGHRLLVPRTTASYHRPLEVLWPQANMLHGVAALNGYGPLWPTENRLLFRFMAWGSSEDMLELLRNVPLLEAMGVRFIAVRSDEERALLAAASRPPARDIHLEPILGTEALSPVPSEEGVLWPIRIDAAGVYELTFAAEPVAGSTARWFVRLETTPHDELAATRSLDPVDLSEGPRRMRFLFHCQEAAGAAYVRIKSESGIALAAGRAQFGLIAEPDPADTAVRGVADGLVHRADVPGNVSAHEAAPAGISEVVSLYELPSALPVLWLAEQVEPVRDVNEAVERLLGAPDKQVGLPRAAVVEWTSDDSPPSGTLGRIELAWRRRAGHVVEARVKSSESAFLVFNESYNPGWGATLNAQAVPLHRVNAVCQGLVVPSGEHEVRLQYWPTGLSIGIIATVAALLLALIGWVPQQMNCRRINTHAP